MFRFVIVLLFLTGVWSTKVEKCANNKAFPLSVNVEGCEQPPCSVIKGSSVVMHVGFTPNKTVTGPIKAQVLATALGVTVPYQLPAKVADVCSNLENGLSCPIQASQEVLYKFDFHVEDYYPEISASIQVSLVDEENNETISCFVCSIKVKRRNTSQQANLI